MTVFLDSNIFLRAILNDDPEKAAVCLAHLEKVDEGKLEAATSLLVLNEVLWVLEGYKVETRDITARIEAIVSSKVDILGTGDGSPVLESLAYYRELGVDFIDALNACLARQNKIHKVVTYDAHFKEIGFVEATVPEDV